MTRRATSMTVLLALAAAVAAAQVCDLEELATISAPGGEVLAYASVVDNGSNDPIFIPAQRLSNTSPFTE